MIVRTDNVFVVDGGFNSRTDYWGGQLHPEWAALRMIRHIPGQRTGAGVEPHYHDADEFWLFLSGRGEVWLDGQSAPITPNTLVYTPMGVVHRFQMFTDFANVPAVTRLERAKRAIHILPDVHGPPEPTVPGFVIQGQDNHGPIADRGSRCPVSEMRALALPAGSSLDDAPLPRTEYWIVLDGVAQLGVGNLQLNLTNGDLAIIRQGARRQLGSDVGCTLALARE